MTNVQYDIEDYKDCEIINMYHERLEKGYSKDEIMKSFTQRAVTMQGHLCSGMTRQMPASPQEHLG